MWGVQSSSYSVMLPDVTMIRLWPGCVCQPVLATAPVVGLTGGQTLLCTYRSDDPFVFCIDSQTSPPNPAGSESFEEWLKTSNSPKVPEAMVEALKPEEVVARTFFVRYRAVTIIAAPRNTSQVLFPRIGNLLFSLASPHGARLDKIGYHGGRGQTAMRGIAAVPLLAVECCVVRSPAADATIAFVRFFTLPGQTGERGGGTVPLH